MRYTIVSIKDRGTDTFSPISLVKHRNEALRMFMDMINQPQGDQAQLMSRHADDFDLYLLGYWDDQHGRFELLDDPELIIQGKQAKQTA